MIILENELSKVIKDNEQDDSLELTRRQRQYLKQNYNIKYTPIYRAFWYAIIMTSIHFFVSTVMYLLGLCIISQ